MKKVLLISENPASSYGGIERHCYNISQMFFQTDVEIQLASIDCIEYTTNYFLNKKIFKRKSLDNLILNSNCDIVHIHGFASITVWQALRSSTKFHKKIIWTPHFHPFYTLERPLLGRLFFEILIRPLLPNISVIVCINREDLNFFSCYNVRTVMLPNWLSKDLLVPNMGMKKKNMVLFVGRNDSNKSPNYLLSIPRGRYEIHCVTDSPKGLRNDFIFHKGISDKELKELYSHASLLVAPSRYEAFSYVVLEALNNNTPVLVSDRVRIIDHLQGISGINIFHYGNKDEFVDKIDLAMLHPVDIETIRNVFGEDKAFAKLHSLYCDNLL